MSKAFSVAWWNVEHFGVRKKKKKKFAKDPRPIIELIANQNADVIAIGEVRSNDVFQLAVEEIPNHQFFITEGPQHQEIMVGIKGTFSAFLTQKTEFKSGQTTLRPGMLVTLVIDRAYYPLLFLHLKSMRDPKGFGLRDDMLTRAFDFRKKLKKAGVQQDGEPNYIFVGDFNTMGMDYRGSDKDITGKRETRELGQAANRRKMSLLGKSRPYTYWSKKYGSSDLDHVVAANHLRFKDFDGSAVKVIGWPDEATSKEKKEWVKKYSDHALLYFEVQKI